MNGLRAVAGIITVLAVATPSSTRAEPTVSGQALYRERIALPPDAVFEATLEDVSRADGKAGVLGTFRLPNAGPVPIRFEIPYDAARIDERHAYSVRGRILVADRLLFTTAQANPVLTRGHGNVVELLLVRAREDVPTHAAAPLENTHWILDELGGKRVPPDVPQKPHLVLQGEPRRVSGSGGCNQLSGAYELDGERLRFKLVASTRKACIQGGMDTEAAFYAALEQTRTFRVSGRRLELIDGTEQILAVFGAGDLPHAVKPEN